MTEAPTAAVTSVVPVFRNEADLEELVERLAAALEAAAGSGGGEMLFVDDHSPDGSRAVLRRLAARDERITVLGLSRNVGQQGSVLLGLSEVRTPWAVVLDADLQDPPEAIPRLLAAATPGVEVVFAGRRGAYEGPLRLVSSHLFKAVLHHLTGLPRDAGAFVMLRRPVVDRLLSLPVPYPSLLPMIGRLGPPPWRSVPVERARRARGGSAYGALGRLRVGGEALVCLFADRLPGLGGRPLAGLDPVDLVEERLGSAARGR